MAAFPIRGYQPCDAGRHRIWCIEPETGPEIVVRIVGAKARAGIALCGADNRDVARWLRQAAAIDHLEEPIVSAGPAPCQSACTSGRAPRRREHDVTTAPPVSARFPFSPRRLARLWINCNSRSVRHYCANRLSTVRGIIGWASLWMFP